MMIHNVMLKALNSKVQENLKNSMTMDIHRKFFIYKIIHMAHITHVYGLIVDPVVFLDPDPVLEIR